MQQKQESELANGARHKGSVAARGGSASSKQCQQGAHCEALATATAGAELEAEANMAKTQGNQASLMKRKST